MAVKVPVRAVFSGSNATGLAEYQSGEFIALAHGGIGAALSIGTAGQVLKVNSGASALEFGSVEAVLNIDGMTDGSGVTIVDADKIAVSDGGTEKYVLASQFKTYVTGANSIDSDQYVDGSIDTAHIADDQVTLAKMAGLARGKIIYGNSTGNPTALTVGSSGQSLISDGTDISWGAGGAITSYTNSTNNRVLTSVSSTTVNSEANLTFDGSVLAATGNITATGTIEPAGDTAAGDNAAIGYTSAEGLILTGQGSTNDITIKNDADAAVIQIPTGTTNVTIAGNLTVTGDYTVNGDTTTVNTATLSVEDPLIIVGSGNNTADSVDLGIYGLYDTSGSQDLYSGLFRDATDTKWKLFTTLQTAPTTTVNTSGTGYAVGTLVANLEGNVTGNTSGTAATVTTAAQSNITSLGTLTTLTVDNVIINATTIGHTGDTDLLTLASGVLTVAGEVDAVSLDVSGDADIDGTLETDALTIGGVTLAETIADTVGAMVTANTESGITVAYDDADNTLDFTVGTLNQNTTGSAATLTTTRTIAGVSFDGSANIAIASTDLSNTSAIALLTASQTMTNKTLTTPQINTQIDMLARAELRFQDASGGQYVALEAPATVSSSVTFTLPSADGDADQVLTTDGSGALSFSTVGGSGFTNSTITTAPGSGGNFILTKSNNTGSEETPFDSSAADAFGVGTGVIFDLMEPIGLTGTTTDFGSVA
jgi:hypothetical protein